MMEQVTYAMALADRYDLIEPPIGEGSFGAVYLADDRKMPRKVAIKVLHANYANDPKVSARFLRELVAACRVSHENVIQVLDVGDDPEHGLFYVMEFAEGVALDERLSGRAISWPILQVVAQQLAAALHAIHQAGIVHRDLKPRNIMLVERSSQDDLVKVLDFGIAVIHDGEFGDDVELTGTRMVVGTPPYMSPEQTYMKSDRERLGLEVDGRSDLYALGVILYEMTVGHRPFSGDAHELALAHRHDAPNEPHGLASPDVPKGFCDLVMRLLAKTPDQRPASAEQVLTTLRALGSGANAVVSPRGVQQDAQDAATCIVDALSAPVADAQTMNAEALEARGPGTSSLEPHELAAVRRSRWPLWLVAVTALAVFALFTISERDSLDDHLNPQSRGAVDVTPSSTEGEDVEVEARRMKTEERGYAAPASADQVSLMVTSLPAGAEVWLDGVIVGTTPLATTLSCMKPAKHLLELQTPGHTIRQIPLAVAPHLAGKALVFNETLEEERTRRRPSKAKQKGAKKAPQAKKATQAKKKHKSKASKHKVKKDPLGEL